MVLAGLRDMMSNALSKLAELECCYMVLPHIEQT